MGREDHCKQTPLACVGSVRRVSATLGLSPLTVCVLSRSTLLRLQVALPGNCMRRALGWVHFPGLSRSGDQVLGERSHPQLEVASYLLPRPSRSGFWVYKGRTFSGVPVSPLGS